MFYTEFYRKIASLQSKEVTQTDPIRNSLSNLALDLPAAKEVAREENSLLRNSTVR
jgi:hypothetical protein